MTLIVACGQIDETSCGLVIYASLFAKLNLDLLTAQMETLAFYLKNHISFGCPDRLVPITINHSCFCSWTHVFFPPSVAVRRSSEGFASIASVFDYPELAVLFECIGVWLMLTVVCMTSQFQAMVYEASAFQQTIVKIATV